MDLPNVADVGIAVAVLLAVLWLVWKQFCALQDKVIAAMDKQSTATAAQAVSNGEVAKAITRQQEYMERQAEGELSYRSGMKDFATSMTETAGEALKEMREHRKATEAAEAADPPAPKHKRTKA